MTYRENPKTAGSGIICCIPQEGTCPNGCEDCFFQSGRSYLEPLAENLPNMPPDSEMAGRVVRVNDGNDSSVFFETVATQTDDMQSKFYNTAIPNYLDLFHGPVVLTINPGVSTNAAIHEVDPVPRNLMFVRFRTNTWNLDLLGEAITYYVTREVPVILTFMAYFNAADKIPEGHRQNYSLRKRTLNEYWAITHDAWREIMVPYSSDPWVHSCGTEGVSGGSACRHCGNCLREYFATMERIRKDQSR